MILEQCALSGNYDEKNHFSLFSMRGLVFRKKHLKKISKLLEYQKILAEKYLINSSQIPIIWAEMKGVVPLIRVMKASHINDIVKGDKIVLKEQELMKLELLARETKIKLKGRWENNVNS